MSKKVTSGKRESMSWHNSMKSDEHTKLKCGDADGPYARYGLRHGPGARREDTYYYGLACPEGRGE